MNITHSRLPQIHTASPWGTRLQSPPSLSLGANIEPTNDTVNLSHEASSIPSLKPPSRGFVHSAGLVLMTGISLIGGLTGTSSVAAQAATPEVQIMFNRENYNGPTDIPKQLERPTKGVKYDYTKAEVEAAVTNDVTADQLKVDEFEFTAHGVDSLQASKKYHNPDTLTVLSQGAKTVRHKKRHKMCASTTRKGDRCRSAFSTQTKHSVLSCVYKNKADGEFYRVVHRSESFDQTNPMQRNVCGGHVLRKSGFSYEPQQVSKKGEKLYLNPDHIIQVRTLTPTEHSRYTK